LILFHVRLGVHFLTRGVDIPQGFHVWRYDARDAGAAKRARVVVLHPSPNALITNLVVEAWIKEGSGLLRDLIHTNGAWKFDVFGGSVSGRR
jgi:hypothetical protein